MKYIFLILSLMGCGRVETVDRFMGPTDEEKVYKPIPDIDNDDDLKTVVTEFYDHARLLGRPIEHTVKSVRIVDEVFGEGMVGYCQQYKKYIEVISGEVKLKREFWDRSSYEQRRLLVYHELGHCALDLEHTPPDSDTIMQPYLLSDKDIYRVGWDKLVAEEFK